MGKEKYCKILLVTKHLPDLEKSISQGALNSTQPLWLAAFAVYNMNNKLHLSVNLHDSYQRVFNFIKEKLT